MDTTATGWPFSASADFESVMDQMRGATDLGNGRFHARNFVLERAVHQDRTTSYLDGAGDVCLAAGPQAQLTALQAHHERYIQRCVRPGHRLGGFDVTADTCPETFRLASDFAEFGLSDDQLLLVRMEPVLPILRRADRERDELEDIVRRAESVAAANRDGSDASPHRDELDDVLWRWQSFLDNRPVFAAFWEEAKAVLEPPQTSWPDEMRDRLGLLHHSPGASSPRDPLYVVAFRYPLSLVPRVGKASRAVVRPTVLDGKLSEAFCTAPPQAGTGCTIDLASREDGPWQEVVHPAVEFRASHLWAVGKIVKDPPASLDVARGIHQHKVCTNAESSFVELVEDVDRDIL